MAVAGTYNCIVKTPMGDQKGVFTVVPGDDGSSFTGNLSSDMMGTMDIEGGSISGDTLSWKMDMKVPMPMTLDCNATVDGDALAGKIDTGSFGTMDISGTRA